MILPETYAAAICLMLLSAICLGSWANTYKASHVRFELYYFDFAFGVVIAAAISAFTVGSMGFDGFTFLDDLLHASKHALLYAFTAGVVFNLANMLLMAGIAVAGMAVAFAISAGLALLIGVVISHLSKPSANPFLTFAGCLLVFAAILAAGAVYRFVNEIRHEASARAGKAKSTRRPAAVKGIVVSLLSGLFMGACYPLIERAREGEFGFGPYSLLAVFTGGLLFSTFIFNLFFMLLPIEGQPVDFMDYFKFSPRSHALALGGGAIWSVGTLAAFTAASAENVHLLSSLSYGFSEVPALVAFLWGALVWREFKDGDARVKSLAGLTLMLFALGVILVSLAQSVTVRTA
jgi:glucose uptake protein